ncbi:MAG: hypothetical protein ABEL76_07375, partial [Bradymonadaceae bacterium]
ETTIRKPGATVPAGGYSVLVRETDSSKNGGISGGIPYQGVSLVNSPGSEFSPTLKRSNGTVVDRAHYGTPSEGASQQLDRREYLPSAKDGAKTNDDGANWCDGRTTYGQGDDGTPATHNLKCF